MDLVIVTVKRENEARVRDLEVPADMPSAQLASLIAEWCGWNQDPGGKPVRYEIHSTPPDRILAPDETLAQAQAWDGAWLVLKPDRGITQQATPSPGVPAKPSPSPIPGPTPGKGYKFVKIDED